MTSTEKINVVASHLKRLGDLMPPLDPSFREPEIHTPSGTARCYASPSSPSRKAKGKLQ